MLWFDFLGFIFFKPVKIFQTGLKFFKQDRNFQISLYSSILFSPILAEFLLIYSIPQLL